MFVGHYGPAYLATAAKRTIPLWVTFVAVQLIDVLWAVLVLLGVEKVRIVPGATGPDALDNYYMPYTHSLFGAVLWSVAASVAWFLLRMPGGKSIAVLVGVAALSHWVLDLLVHRPDLPLVDDTLKVGFGLWDYQWGSLVLELALLFGGMYLYLKGTEATSRVGRYGMVVFCSALAAVQAYFVFSRPVGSGRVVAATLLGMYAVFATIAAWLDRQRIPHARGHDARGLLSAG